MVRLFLNWHNINHQLGSWIRDNKSLRWSVGIKFVQFQYNASVNRGIGTCPFKALFGMEPHIGLKSTLIPSSKWSEIRCEQDVVRILNTVKINDQLVNKEKEMDIDEVDDDEEEHDEDDDRIDGDLENEINDLLEKERRAEEEEERKRQEEEKERARTIENIPVETIEQIVINTNAASIRKTRASVNNKQGKNADKMVNNSDKLLGRAAIGDSVVFFVSEFDRGLADPPNILCKVIDIDKHHNYQLACGAGILNRYLPRNAFQTIPSTIEYPINRETIVTPREAVTILSVGEGQGFVKCECLGQCKTKRCKCMSMSLKCKSRCHGTNNSCLNKE